MTMMMRFRTVACILAWAAAGGGYALQINVPVVPFAPLIDGKLSAQEASTAAKVTMTVMGSLDKPKHPTTAYTFLCKEGLYVAFVCDEPAPDKLVTRITQENGAVFEDDSVQLFVAPEREANNTNYFHFAVNPAGVKYSTSMEQEVAVEGWTAAASLNANQWSAEMLIPYSAIQANTEVPYWRINLARERPERSGDRKETSAWINPGASLHNYKRFGFFQIASALPVAQNTPVIAAAAQPTTASIVGVPAAPGVVTTSPTTAANNPETTSTPLSGVFFGSSGR